MQTIYLGECCDDCFNAINGGEAPAVNWHEIANVKLREDFDSLATDTDNGVGQTICVICKTIKTGSRYDVYGFRTLHSPANNQDKEDNHY